ncbi:hypothetical protein RI367_005260 [Sorochytrium milnesiophthora]
MTKKSSKKAREQEKLRNEKENNAAATTATAATATETPADVQWMCGLWLELTTIANETIVAQVANYDRRSGVLALHAPAADSLQSTGKNALSTHQRLDIRFVKTSYIAQVSVLPAAPEQFAALATESLPLQQHEYLDTAGWTIMHHIDDETIRKRETQSLRAMQERIARIGVGVAQEAQDIFDALSKTMECRWNEQQIVVMDLVVIDPPYKPANCKGNDQRALHRVQKVLEGERKKLFGSNSNGSNTAAAAARPQNGTTSDD